MADAIFTAGSLFLNIALVRMVFGSPKPPRFSSLTTGLWLAAFAAVDGALLSLPFACVSTASSAFLWLTLAYQAEKW